MKIILATANKGKLKEIKEFFQHDEVIAFSDLIGDLEIEESGDSFKANALIKARAIDEKLTLDEPYSILSDDSGISVPALGGIPNIYSARFAGVGASDKENLNKLIQTLKDKNITRTLAFYTSCIALRCNNQEYTMHGFMYGEVIDEARGTNGFGYDPMFIPEGFAQTLGQMQKEEKYALSHRTKALKLAQTILKVLK